MIVAVLYTVNLPSVRYFTQPHHTTKVQSLWRRELRWKL